MKKIEAIILEEQLDSVKEALEEAGFIGMTISGVKGRGSEGGIELRWRAMTYNVDFLPRILLMLVVEDAQVQKAVDTIIATCQSPEFQAELEHEAQASLGKIFVSPVDSMISIRKATVPAVVG